MLLTFPLLSPSAAAGQPLPPHLSVLVVTIHGEPAPDGTEITAWMEGVQVAAATTSGGRAVISILGTAESTDKAITFRIDGLPAAQEDTWEPGGHIDKNFSISITSPTPAAPNPAAPAPATPAPIIPHLSNLTAWMEGVQVVAATTREGVAVISIPGTSRSAGKTISFKIDAIPAPEEDTWERGGHIDKEFAISATSPGPEPGHLAEPVVAIDDRPALDETLVIPVASVTEVEDSTTTPGAATISIPDPPDSLGETSEFKTHGIPSTGEDTGEPIDGSGNEFAIELKTPQPDETPEPLSNDASPSTANPSISKPSVFGPVQRSLYVSASGIIAFQALEML